MGGINLYGFVGNKAIVTFDRLGLQNWEWFSIVSKSYINGVGNIGDLGNREGKPWRPEDDGKDNNREALFDFIDLFIPESVTPEKANARLTFFAIASARQPAFNQRPTNDQNDGQYRLYSKVFMEVCCKDGKPQRKNDGWAKGGGKEGPGISGTMHLRYRFIDKENSFQVVWTGWGRPNLAVEEAFQWVAYRNNRYKGLSIWHEGTATVTCEGNKPKYKLDSFLGSKYPSRQVWFNGESKREVAQGAFSDLWDEHPTRKGFVK